MKTTTFVAILGILIASVTAATFPRNDGEVEPMGTTVDPDNHPNEVNEANVRIEHEYLADNVKTHEFRVTTIETTWTITAYFTGLHAVGNPSISIMDPDGKLFLVAKLDSGPIVSIGGSTNGETKIGHLKVGTWQVVFEGDGQARGVVEATPHPAR